MSGAMILVGGCGGIGRDVAAQATRAGWRVAVLDLPQSLGRHPPDGPAFPVDVTDHDAVSAAMHEARNAIGPFDGMVMLAGFAPPAGPLAQDNEWHEVIDGNLTGTRNAAIAALPYMREGSAMVLTGSGLGHRPRPGYGAYAAAKAGIAALGRQLAIELAPAIRVNTVAPSAVDTAFLRGGLAHAAENAAPQIDLDAYAAAIPLGRIAVPSDVTGPILFLLSDAAAYITGQTIHVNGGSFMP